MNVLRIYVLLQLSAQLLLTACNPTASSGGDERFETDSFTVQANADSAIVEEDPLIIRFDSLMSIRVPVPPLIDNTIIDKVAAKHFAQLSDGTGGELSVLLSSKYVAKEMAAIIEKNALDSADILIMIDKTGSMSDDIQEVNRNIDLILASLNAYSQIRLAVATFGDRNEDGTAWFGFENFGSATDRAARYIKSIHTTGGGDYPESVSDAFFKVMDKNFFRSGTKRMVLLIGDAPSLQPPLARYSVEDMVERATRDGIKMNFYPVLLYAGDRKFSESKPRMKHLDFINKLYPNPCSALLQVELSESGSYTFELFDQTGKKLSGETLETTLYNKDMSGYPEGVYVIRVSDKRRNYDAGKFIVAH